MEVVDELGMPVLPPDHTESELAAILATDPLNDPVFAAEFAARDVSPDGLPGRVVLPAELLLEDLGRLAPGMALVGSLEKLTGAPALDALDGAELRSVVAGWERVASWVRAAQARVAAELMTRTDDPLGRDSAAGEIAAELHATTPEGWQIAMRGEGTAAYPQLAEALATGHIDAKKADTFLRAGADLTPEERGKAIDDLLPGSRRRTWKWISEQMNARAADLHGTKARHRHVTERCNVWAEQAGPGMGRITADLPVVDTARTFNTVQAAAKALKDVPGETRPLGALRAAAFAALLTGDLVLPCPDEADEVDDGDAGGGVMNEPPRLVEPVLDTDLIPTPHDPHGIALTGPAPTSGTDSEPTGSDVVSSGTRIRVVDVAATVNVTVPATMLLDPDDTTPGILDGIGPIPADAASRIAADGTWRRLLTDPVTGVLTDYSTRTYTPGATLRSAVTARDRTCMFPGCHRPAYAGNRASADLDHIEPFDREHRYRPGEPGQTRATNLHPLCRKHHNLKTHANWSVTRDPDTGITRWIAPTGRTAIVEPTVVDPTIRYALAKGMTLAEPRETAPPESPPTPGTGRSASGSPPF